MAIDSFAVDTAFDVAQTVVGLLTVGLLFKFSVAVKEVTYIGELFMKPFNSSLVVVC